MKTARIATGKEIDAVAKRIKSKTQSFGKDSSDKYAKESSARLKSFCGRFK